MNPPLGFDYSHSRPLETCIPKYHRKSSDAPGHSRPSRSRKVWIWIRSPPKCFLASHLSELLLVRGDNRLLRRPARRSLKPELLETPSLEWNGIKTRSLRTPALDRFYCLSRRSWRFESRGDAAASYGCLFPCSHLVVPANWGNLDRPPWWPEALPGNSLLYRLSSSLLFQWGCLLLFRSSRGIFPSAFSIYKGLKILIK